MRRFVVRDRLSEPVSSFTGFPEGCPLSPIAMLLTGWAFHQYASEFTPEVLCLSLADKLSACRQWPEALLLCSNGLELDSAKILLWSTQKSSQPALNVLETTVSSHARELGGFLSFMQPPGTRP